MSANPNKRIVYIWPEHLAFWESLDNKSDVVNRHLGNLKAELPGQTDLQSQLQEKLKAIDERTHTDRSPKS